MTHAQRILLAGYLLFQRFAKEGIELTEGERCWLYHRIEAWCAKAQVEEGR